MSDEDGRRNERSFSTTQWTRILHVIQEGQADPAAKALEAFCEQYRAAIYGFFRRRGQDHHRAEDLVQEFFETKVLKQWATGSTFLHEAERGRCVRFRSFLCQVLIRFLQDKQRAERAEKRGGTAVHESVEQLAEEGMTIPASMMQAEYEFDREFATELIQQASRSVSHAEHHLALLKGERTQAEVAGLIGLSENAVKQGHHRFRRQLAREIREAVQRTVGDEKGAVEEEIRYLMSLYGKSP